MSAAIGAMAYAALEAELAARARRHGDVDRERRHGGWCLVLFVVGVYCALAGWLFG